MAYITLGEIRVAPGTPTRPQAGVQYTGTTSTKGYSVAPQTYTNTAAPKDRSIPSSNIPIVKSKDAWDTIGDTLAALFGAGAAVAPVVMQAVEAKRAQTQARRDARQQAAMVQEQQAGPGSSMMPLALGALGVVLVGAWLFSGRTTPVVSEPRAVAPAARIQYRTRTVYKAKPKAKPRAKARAKAKTRGRR